MSTDNEATIDTMLNNLAKAKGEHPTTESDDSSTKDALAAAKQEVDRLFAENRHPSRHLNRDQIDVGVARWKSRNGYCRYNCRLTKERFGERVDGYMSSHGNHSLVINERMWENDDHDSFIDTVRHELAHAVAYEKFGSNQKHNANWKKMARHLGADPSSCHNTNKGVDKPYIFGCPNGCFESGKSRRSKKVKRPWSRGRYCKHCGATPASADAGTDITELDEGEVAVESIEWSSETEYQNLK
jgi:predicted SprT family Zn-dependent metalloprotease